MLCIREKRKEEMMLTDRSDDPCTYRSTDDIHEILQRYDAYIVALARAKMPRTVVPLALLTDEREELAQRVRIKLWQTLQKRRVVNLKAYIDCIVFTEVIDLLRRHRSPLPLPLDDDEEYSWEDVLGVPPKDTHDPAQEIEQEEALDALTKEVAAALLHLPPRQFQAMLCALKDRIDDVLPLIDALKKNGVNIDEIHWPQAKNEVKNWRISLSIARRKLRPLKRQWEEVCQ
jgi:DNA-directed RNA polymerase specialized sigma24 family protein